MNREIKFRVFDKSLNKMQGVKELYLYESMLKADNGDDFDIYNYNNNYYSEIMQYTGLKDKNGIEIYEGDLVFVNDGFLGKNRELLWNSKTHCWAYKILDNVESASGKQLKGEIRDIQYHRVNDIKIIGNIHKDKHLLADNEDDRTGVAN